ncbi:19436_t:CDS:2 [Dentiscutata erythropus]|uniref:19436_t:CDS:1 n=1 Tax=Dentiscutata erythropus TaxID=1348616 RepID=A0A9N8VGK5_9GLOM|nr:19436_t:CDS:2 [Dentiscutata erythropus]
MGLSTNHCDAKRYTEADREGNWQRVFGKVVKLLLEAETSYLIREAAVSV